MSQLRPQAGFVLHSLILALFLAPTTWSQDPQVPSAADHLLMLALQAELHGDADARRELLDRARASDGNYAPARWHSGEIQVDGQWMALDDAADYFRTDPGLADYRLQRDRAADDPSQELNLARWCRRRGMSDRGDTHLIRVLYNEQSTRDERATAAKLLKWTFHRGVPVPTKDLPRIKKVEREQHDAAMKWAQRISRWTDQLASRVNSSREAAITELLSIRDVHAVPALEVILSRSSEPASRLAVTILGSIPEHAATQSLVRHAVLSPHPAVSNSAIAQLQSRPLHDYIPYLLGALETPIHFASEVRPLSDGRIARNFMAYREGLQCDHTHLGQVISAPAAMVVTGRRVSTTPQGENSAGTVAPSAGPEQRFQRRLLEEQMRSVAMQKQVAAENQRIVYENARVYQVLERVANTKRDRRAVDWWNWWRDYNEVYDPSYEYGKPVSVTSDSVADYYWSGMTVVATSSCFTEGTLVWSETGPVAIQDLRVGDRVLTQDTDSGELAWQGIVARTLRPPTDILRFTVHGDTTPIDCTKGHPFWVNGAGWKMAKEIEAGDRLHTIAGPVEVASIESLADRQPAYNLLVAGNGTYFVGPQGVLVHDNTYRAPTLALVPGLFSTVH